MWRICHCLRLGVAQSTLNVTKVNTDMNHNKESRSAKAHAKVCPDLRDGKTRDSSWFVRNMLPAFALNGSQSLVEKETAPS